MSNKIIKSKSNYDMLKILQNLDPTFENWTANWTKETFTEKGYEALMHGDINNLNSFFELSIRSVLNSIESSTAVDTLEEQGFSQSYTNGYGEYLQRIAVNPIRPINPQYKKLEQYGSVDPFIIRKPTSSERFFQQNFDYQNLITLTEKDARQIFISETGMYDFINAVLQNLESAYEVQKYLAKLECINAGLNSTKYPLKETQKIKVKLDDIPTTEQQTDFVLAIKNLLSEMKVKPTSSKFNAMSFERKQNIDDLSLLVRPEFFNRLKVKALPYMFNEENLNLGINIVEVENFGGIYYTDTAGTKLKPIYDKLGVVIGFNTSGEGEPLADSEMIAVDPNKDTIAVIADNGWIFSTEQLPYMIKPIENPAGLYRNYWASKPNGAINVDYAFTCVRIDREV